MKTVLIVIIFVLIIAATVTWRDSLLEWGLSKVYKEDTVYGVGYSEKAFKRVKKGTTAIEVESLLGKPLAQKAFPEKQKYIWYYSKAGETYDNYRVRLIHFNENKQVMKVVKEYYLD